MRFQSCHHEKYYLSDKSDQKKLGLITCRPTCNVACTKDIAYIIYYVVACTPTTVAPHKKYFNTKGAVVHVKHTL